MALFTRLIFFIAVFAALFYASACKQAGSKNESDHGPEIGERFCGQHSLEKIGFQDSPDKTYLVAPCIRDVNYAIKSVSVSPQRQVFEYDSDVSPDGKWVVVREGKSVRVKNRSTGTSYLLAENQGFAVHEARWSPDSSYVFVWRREDKSIKRHLRECLDDVSDLYLFSTQLMAGGTVGRVCAGVPTGGFRWLTPVT